MFDRCLFWFDVAVAMTVLWIIGGRKKSCFQTSLFLVRRTSKTRKKNSRTTTQVLWWKGRQNHTTCVCLQNCIYGMFFLQRFFFYVERLRDERVRWRHRISSWSMGFSFYFSLQYLHWISIEYYLGQLLIDHERPYSRISLWLVWNLHTDTLFSHGLFRFSGYGWLSMHNMLEQREIKLVPRQICRKTNVFLFRILQSILEEPKEDKGGANT